MTWIKTINEEKAKGKLKSVYDDIIKKRGKLSNIMKIHSLLPETMQTHMDLYLSIMFNKSKLKREEKELIAVVVSSANRCEYCVNHHAEALNHYWKDDERIIKAINDYRSANISAKMIAVLDYAKKLTLLPNEVTEEDVDHLRIYKYTQEEILNINLIVSYFNFVNRIVLGLGVEFSEDEVGDININVL